LDSEQIDTETQAIESKQAEEEEIKTEKSEVDVDEEAEIAKLMKDEDINV
jgi:hypothetical protein